jgi:hypothetical protein
MLKHSAVAVAEGEAAAAVEELEVEILVEVAAEIFPADPLPWVREM